jgi:hypothetical protein
MPACCAAWRACPTTRSSSSASQAAAQSESACGPRAACTRRCHAMARICVERRFAGAQAPADLCVARRRRCSR